MCIVAGEYETLHSKYFTIKPFYYLYKFYIAKKADINSGEVNK